VITAGLDLGLTAVGHLDLIAVGLDLDPVNGGHVLDLVAVGPDLVPVNARLVLDLVVLLLIIQVMVVY